LQRAHPSHVMHALSKICLIWAEHVSLQLVLDADTKPVVSTTYNLLLASECVCLSFWRCLCSRPPPKTPRKLVRVSLALRLTQRCSRSASASHTSEPAKTIEPQCRLLIGFDDASTGGYSNA
jgi:hypothetical protein